MGLRRGGCARVCVAVALIIFWATLHAPMSWAAAAGAPVEGKGESLDALYQRAKAEGRVVVYVAASTNTEQIVFPAFEKQFPGIKVSHVNATADKLLARAIAEARGGKTLGDVLSATLNYVAQAREQGLLLDINLPEAVAYPAALKGPDWVATDTAVAESFFSSLKNEIVHHRNYQTRDETRTEIFNTLNCSTIANAYISR